MAAFGGSSRPDAIQLLVLRPAVVLFFGYALWVGAADALERVRAPLFMLGLFALVMVIQLLPLPPFLWHALPGREVAVASATLADAGNDWSPISLSPLRTWNSLIALIVPLTALLMAGSATRQQRANYIFPLLVLGGASLMLGLAQKFGPPDAPSYFYHYTNRGSTVGLFANRNHQGVFLAALIPVVTVASMRLFRHPLLRFAAILGGTAVLAGGAVYTNSRGAAIFALVAILGTIALYRRQLSVVVTEAAPPRFRRLAIPITLGAILVVTVAAIWIALSMRHPELGADIAQRELRYRALPLYQQMIGQTFPFGTGFGAFERYYQTIEPTTFLEQSYLNHAHNDPVELVIEGGIAAILLMLAFAVWWIRQAIHIVAEPDEKLEGADVAGVIVSFVLMGASVFDYPLRTPLGAVFFVIAIAWMSGARKTADTEPLVTAHAP